VLIISRDKLYQYSITNVMHILFSVYLFLFKTLYMFRAHRVHHQERQIVSIQHHQRDAQILFHIFISIYNSTCFEHIVLIIRRDKFYQYSITNVMHKFFSIYLFLFITLYMFRAHRAHHQERQIVSIQPLATVILCWWPSCVQVGRKLNLKYHG
jgi:hypothetical protein